MARTARRQLPERVADPLDDLRNILRAADPDRVAHWYANASAAERHLIDRLLAEQASLGWRATPATMMLHLDRAMADWRHTMFLGECFADAFHGRDPRQDIEIPSQYGKTTIYGVWGPVWALDMNPRLRIIYIAYDADKAVEEVGRARDIAEEHADQLRFELRPDRRARGYWKTRQGGSLYAVGLNGAISGFPADAAICDDLFKNWQTAHSETERRHAWNIVLSSVRLRLQAKTSPWCLVGTRWHMDDVQGRALNQLDGVDTFHRIRLPARADNKYGRDPLGRAVGEVLEPRRFDDVEVAARARLLGTYLANALEQQDPTPEEGTDIRRAWFRLDDRFPVVYDAMATSWDMKLKDKEAGDFVVGGVWGRTGGDFWLVDLFRGQWNQATAKAAIALAIVRHPQVRTHYIENAGNAPETMDELRSSDAGYDLSADVQGALGATDVEARAVEALIRRGVPGLIGVAPVGYKRVRARATSPIIEAGNVHLPLRAGWVESYLAEMAAFPNGSYDDQVDMTSQALSKMAHMDADFQVATTPVQLPGARQVGTAPRIPMPWGQRRR
jgi:phage terminase large subunit-like protein